MDLRLHFLITKLISKLQCNETTSSNAMELEGLIRGLAFLEQHAVAIEYLVTDRHPSVRKYMREQHPATAHFFDIWHMAKGKCIYLNCYFLSESCFREKRNKNYTC